MVARTHTLGGRGGHSPRVVRTLREALAIRAGEPDATVVAGGTDVMVSVNAGRSFPQQWLDVRHIAELQRVERHNEQIVIGAAVTFATIERELLSEVPALAAAARTVGSVQIRNRATIGGNLATASPAGDSLPVLAACDATVEVASAARGTRLVSLDRFLLGPKTTSLAPDELVVAVHLRRPRGRQAFLKVGHRAAMAIAVCSLAARWDPDRVDTGVGIGAVAPRAVAVPDAAASLATGVTATEFAEAVVAAARPIDDHRASAAYRRHALGVLARRVHAWLQ